MDEQLPVLAQRASDHLQQSPPVARVLEHLHRHDPIEASRRCEVVDVGCHDLDVRVAEPVDELLLSARVGESASTRHAGYRSAIQPVREPQPHPSSRTSIPSTIPARAHVSSSIVSSASARILDSIGPEASRVLSSRPEREKKECGRKLVVLVVGRPRLDGDRALRDIAARHLPRMHRARADARRRSRRRAFALIPATEQRVGQPAHGDRHGRRPSCDAPCIATRRGGSGTNTDTSPLAGAGSRRHGCEGPAPPSRGSRSRWKSRTSRNTGTTIATHPSGEETRDHRPRRPSSAATPRSSFGWRARSPRARSARCVPPCSRDSRLPAGQLPCRRVDLPGDPRRGRAPPRPTRAGRDRARHPRRRMRAGEPRRSTTNPACAWKKTKKARSDVRRPAAGGAAPGSAVLLLPASLPRRYVPSRTPRSCRVRPRAPGGASIRPQGART